MPGRQLPVVTGKKVLQALKKAGFEVDRIVGSHYVLVNQNELARTVTISVHGGRDLKPGTLRSIIRQTGLTVEAFINLL